MGALDLSGRRANMPIGLDGFLVQSAASIRHLNGRDAVPVQPVLVPTIPYDLKPHRHGVQASHAETGR